MPDEYLDLVAAMQSLSIGTEILPMAENEWNTRPDSESYGTIQLDFEVNALFGDNVKKARAYEGSVDLFSYSKHGARWIEEIERTLTEHCEGCWSLNHQKYERNSGSQYDRETGMFHWEWVFQIEG